MTCKVIILLAVVAGAIAQYGYPFNGNPRQQDHSGIPGNVQIDTTGTATQYIGPGFGGPYRGRRQVGYDQPYGGSDDFGGESQYPQGGSSRGGGPGSPGSGPNVVVNGEDYGDRNVNNPGLQINHSPSNDQSGAGFLF